MLWGERNVVDHLGERRVEKGAPEERVSSRESKKRARSSRNEGEIRKPPTRGIFQDEVKEQSEKKTEKW